jgi:hypothetical protein
MMKSVHVDSTRNLPEHDRVLQSMLNTFADTPGVVGCYLSGSAATGKMDEDSDLDIGIVFESMEARDSAWDSRWEWEIAPWFHRFDADHIKPFFVIYLFEPQIKADINLYIATDLPPYEGGPYKVLWDDTSVLQSWQDGLRAPQNSSPDWRSTNHEDERFWAWMFYLYSHVHRGEYYHAAYEFPALRDILEKWAARLEGFLHFKSRYLEDQVYADPLIENDLFPKPDLFSLKTCMVDAIEVQHFYRRKIQEMVDISWRTTDYAINKIENLVRSL